MVEAFLLAAITIAVALVFDFINGFHDAANSISTVVATRVLKPLHAVSMAAVWNFAGAFFFGVAIAKAVGSGIITPEVATINVVLAALIGAIAWNLITWFFGIPSSSSHALIGGLIGAGIMAGGMSAIQFSNVDRIVLFIVLAPLLGMLGAITFTIIVAAISRSFPLHKINSWFKRLQLVSASWYSLGHGTNDAQKTMGVITAVLFSAGLIDSFEVPMWVVLSAYTAIALGTLAGGWRIIKTMGHKITKLQPINGFSAESGGALTLLGTAYFGIPVSTTHVIAGSIMGVGAARRRTAVRWQVARKMFLAWLITIPVSAFIAAVSYLFVAEL